MSRVGEDREGVRTGQERHSSAEHEKCPTRPVRAGLEGRTQEGLTVAPAEHFLHWFPGPRGARTLLPPAIPQLLHLSNPLYIPTPSLQTEFCLTPNPASGMEEGRPRGMQSHPQGVHMDVLREPGIVPLAEEGVLQAGQKSHCRAFL